MRFTLFAGMALTSFALPVLAQPNAGSLLNQQEQQQKRIPQQLPAPEAQPARPPLKKGGAAVMVNAVRFSGDTDLVPEAELQKVVAYAIGQKLDFAGLQQMARRVTDYLHAQGWFLATAYLPQQDVTSGMIEITIRAGRLDGAKGSGAKGKGTPFSIEQNAKAPLRIAPERLSAIATPLLPAGEPAKKGDLERALLLMNDLPGISARARLQPGQSAGTSHVAIDASEGVLFSAAAWADNYGNYATGSGEANLSVQLNDPVHIGDQLTAGAVHSEGMDLQRLGYSLPLGSRGLRLGLNASNMNYSVRNGTGAGTGLGGESTTYGATLGYPIIRSRRLNLSVNGGYDYKVLKDTQASTSLDDKRVDLWNAGLSGDALDRLGGGGLTAWSATWKAGELDLSHNAANAAQDAAGYKTAGHYNTLDYDLSRLQKLPGNFSLYGHVSGQAADKNLDSSAQFILGGPYGVRAYPVGEGSGDEGWLGSLELRYDLPSPTPLGNLQLAGFYDTGAVTLHHNTNGIAIATATGRNHYGLSGWGLGLNLSSSDRYSLRLIWAQTLGNNPGRSVQGKNADDHSDHSRFWLQALVRM